MAKARYTKPTAQEDLERRQKDGNESSLRVVRGEDAPLSDNGYVGVDTVYQNAANNTERPRSVDKGPEAKIFNEFVSEDAEYPELDEDSEDEDAEPSTQSPPPTGTGATPTGGSGGGGNSGSSNS